MYLNSEVIAALETAKQKIAEHTRQAAVDLAQTNDQLLAALSLRHDRRLSIAARRVELDEEEQQVEAQFEADVRGISALITTVKRGMRDDDPPAGADGGKKQIPHMKAVSNG